VAELKSVWLRHEVPAAIAKRLNLPPSDEGIDGIAQTHGGDFWSLQCKFLANPRAALCPQRLGLCIIRVEIFTDRRGEPDYNSNIWISIAIRSASDPSNEASPQGRSLQVRHLSPAHHTSMTFTLIFFK